jgi:hypothetical protein
MNSNQLNSDNIIFQIEQSTNIGAIQQPSTIYLEKKQELDNNHNNIIRKVGGTNKTNKEP